ncbi:MAG TPA: ion transporter [Erythrobacter sp.]|nr:ion transporter [Erythrobacter sp.]
MKLRRFLYQQLHVGSERDGRLTPLNKLLVCVIVAAVITAIMATEVEFDRLWHDEILMVEFGFGLIFLAEYFARVYSAVETPGPGSNLSKRLHFVFSPLGVIDLLVVALTFAPLFISHPEVLRVARLLRVISIMKFGRFTVATREMAMAIRERSYDLLVCMGFAFIFLLAGASALYWIEGELQPEAFGSIPRALWWAVITFTTVGYGDVYPITAAGRIVGSLVAITGVLLVALPTGIVAAAFSDAMQHRREEIAKALLELEREIEEARTVPDEEASDIT